MFRFQKKSGTILAQNFTTKSMYCTTSELDAHMIFISDTKSSVINLKNIIST